MRKQLTKVFVTTVIVLLATSLGAFPITYAEQPAAEQQIRAFIENVLPVDLSKYNITLTKHTTDSGPPIAGVTGQPISRVIDSLRYTLDSPESTIRVSLLVQNNAVLSCNIYVDKGQVISDRQYTSLIDAAKTFLERYQTHTKIDSTDMVSMLDDKVDVTKDSSKTMGNTKLTISNIDYYGVKQTSFKWAYTVNEADYTSLQLCFQKNGLLYSFSDDRGVYSIGDTTVSVSSEQAIDIATKYIETYSYDMPNDYKVSGFNITEDQTTAQIETYPINSSELRPYWNVKLYLNQTYPGSVKGFSIYVWANSGELFSCTKLAYGGVEPSNNLDSESSTTSPSPLSSETNEASIGLGVVAVIAVATLAIAVASIALVVKKRSK